MYRWGMSESVSLPTDANKARKSLQAARLHVSLCINSGERNQNIYFISHKQNMILPSMCKKYIFA